MILGIDEAGRGPILGPLVLCGVLASSGEQRALVRAGVGDSKTYGSGSRGTERRSQLGRLIEQVAMRVSVRVASADEVDRWVEGAGLNALERELARQIISENTEATRIRIDGERIFTPLKDTIEPLEAVDRADASCVVVGAASIVAKVVRDSLVSELLAPHQADFGPIRGNGYCNQGTADFLEAFWRQHSRLPDGTRQTWRWQTLSEIRGR